MIIQLQYGAVTRIVLGPIDGNDEMLIVSLMRVFSEGGTVSTQDNQGNQLWTYSCSGVPKEALAEMPVQLRKYLACLEVEEGS